MVLEVLLATPLESNAFRVFLSKEPRRWSPLAEDDVLLRDNWTISLTSGPGKSPVIEGIENPQPRDDFAPDAWSVDVRTAERILLASTYTIVASPSIESADGVDSMSGPPDDRWTAPGIAKPRERLPQRPQATGLGVDFRYDFFAGRFVLDSRSDFDVQGGIEALKKRLLRRFVSKPGGFFHLPRYGANLKVKEPFNSLQINRIRQEVRAQVLSEAEVLEAEVSVAKLAPGTVLVDVRAKTVGGPGFSLAFELQPGGAVAVV